MMLIITFAFVFFCRGNLVCFFIDHSASHIFYIEIVRMAGSLMGLSSLVFFLTLYMFWEIDWAMEG